MNPPAEKGEDHVTTTYTNPCELAGDDGLCAWDHHHPLTTDVHREGDQVGGSELIHRDSVYLTLSGVFVPTQRFRLSPQQAATLLRQLLDAVLDD